MESMIDTNEQLQTALNQHQRAVLNARKQLGVVERSNSHTPANDVVYEGGPPRQQSWQNAAAAASGSRSNLNATPPPTEPKRLPSPPSGKGKGKGAADWVPSPDRDVGPERSTNGTPPGPPPSHGYGTDRYNDETEDPFRDPTPEPPRNGASGSGSGRRPSDQPLRLAVDSFHPGFGTTPSYIDRQDSAMDKLQMHGAAGAVSPVSEGTNTIGAEGLNGLQANKSAESRYDVDDEDDDRYDATPKKDGPVFRY